MQHWYAGLAVVTWRSGIDGLLSLLACMLSAIHASFRYLHYSLPLCKAIGLCSPPLDHPWVACLHVAPARLLSTSWALLNNDPSVPVWRLPVEHPLGHRPLAHHALGVGETSCGWLGLPGPLGTHKIPCLAQTRKIVMTDGVAALVHRTLLPTPDTPLESITHVPTVLVPRVGVPSALRPAETAHRPRPHAPERRRDT